MTGAVSRQQNGVRPEWLALVHEDALDPAIEIIDSHHHLWDRPDTRYLAAEALDDIGGGHDVAATVFVEGHAMYRAEGDPAYRSLGETEFAAAIAAASTGPTRLAAAIVGHVDLRLGDQIEDVLAAHIEAAGGRFRGVRNNSAWDPEREVSNPRDPVPPGLLADQSFRRGFARLGPLGLSFDAWMFHPQLGDALSLADAFPDTRIVIGHSGGPVGVGRFAGRRGEVFAAWSDSVRALARRPNIFMKLGGLGMRMNGFGFEAGELPPSSRQLAEAWRPYIETCIESFGAARCLFESNFPVDKGSAGYTILWNAFKRIAAGASPAEKARLFAGTAREIYFCNSAGR